MYKNDQNYEFKFFIFSDAWKTPILNTQQRPSGLETTAITPEMFMQIDEANQ